MDESINLLVKIKQEFDCKDVDLRTYSPLTLAFLGDCVYDIIIRTVVVERGNRAAQGLHKKKSYLVNAKTQKELIESIQDLLTEEEENIYRRGRNAKSYTTAKNASVGDYRKATGFEALLGYLYLDDKMDRVIYLIKEGLNRIGAEI
jgi:ribonuclease-3 family protein